ncbi:hypothetical protein Sgleb_09630 [Streptomyces glebosus]|uniref:Uncharacterized protein n=1 Tax=Streptomyces glebosus TaxID=249580 RepID=A0A640SS36_9ACTN|nr:hypothetical protein Sgleb_09630 [Streptomyces glebosus]GHG57387.1 hypothetical protein GCM10010513_20780 [Streptomyces glebosus]
MDVWRSAVAMLRVGNYPYSGGYQGVSERRGERAASGVGPAGRVPRWAARRAAVAGSRHAEFTDGS